MFEETTNQDRAEWALLGLEAFGRRTRQVRSEADLSDEALSDWEWFRELAGDFIGDLAHLARQHGHDIHEVFQAGLYHFEAEVAEEDEEENELIGA